MGARQSLKKWNKIVVVLAGHTRSKLENLVCLYKANKPSLEHEAVVVYNGKGRFPNSIKCRNSSTGRDIHMYRVAMNRYIADFYFFMNDDVVCIKGSEWLDFCISRGTEIIGAQTNLFSIVPIDVIRKRVKHVSWKWKRWGAESRFIRTSAFGCTRKCFERLWNDNPNQAQRFEKSTTRLSESWSVFDDPFYIHDSNIAPYADKVDYTGFCWRDGKLDFHPDREFTNAWYVCLTREL